VSVCMAAEGESGVLGVGVSELRVVSVERDRETQETASVTRVCRRNEEGSRHVMILLLSPCRPARLPPSSLLMKMRETCGRANGHDRRDCRYGCVVCVCRESRVAGVVRCWLGKRHPI
jgi:hypothetical protein